MIDFNRDLIAEYKIWKSNREFYEVLAFNHAFVRSDVNDTLDRIATLVPKKRRWEEDKWNRLIPDKKWSPDCLVSLIGPKTSGYFVRVIRSMLLGLHEDPGELIEELFLKDALYLIPESACKNREERNFPVRKGFQEACIFPEYQKEHARDMAMFLSFMLKKGVVDLCHTDGRLIERFNGK